MSVSNYAELALLNAVGNAAAFSVATPYIKLHVGDPGEEGTSFPAVETTRKLVSFAAAAAGAMVSDADVAWTNVAGTEDFTHFSLWDHVSAGNCLWYGTVTANAVVAGDSFVIEAGDLSLALD